jgi:hypothetical protein
VTVGDFNGDGILDIAAANRLSNDVTVLLGNGGGSFGLQQRYTVGREPVSVIAGDFNGDGRLDLAVANRSSDDISILLNQLPPLPQQSSSTLPQSNPQLVDEPAADLRALATAIDAAARSSRPGGRGVIAALPPVVDLLLDDVDPNARPAWMDWISGEGDRTAQLIRGSLV